MKGLRVLPEFKGYTFDFRLREIRKIKWGQRYEFIDFSSAEGKRLLKECFASPEGQQEIERYLKECERDGCVPNALRR